MADHELDIDSLFDSAFSADKRVSDLIDAIDLASDQDTTTWLLAGGKRIAQIAPVDNIPPGTAAWARDARVSASEFMALPAGRRRDLLDRFYERLHSQD